MLLIKLHQAFDNFFGILVVGGCGDLAFGFFANNLCCNE
jgi:hypothetical protein